MEHRRGVINKYKGSLCEGERREKDRIDEREEKEKERKKERKGNSTRIKTPIPIPLHLLAPFFYFYLYQLTDGLDIIVKLRAGGRQHELHPNPSFLLHPHSTGADWGASMQPLNIKLNDERFLLALPFRIKLPVSKLSRRREEGGGRREAKIKGGSRDMASFFFPPFTIAFEDQVFYFIPLATSLRLPALIFTPNHRHLGIDQYHSCGR